MWAVTIPRLCQCNVHPMAYGDDVVAVDLLTAEPGAMAAPIPTATTSWPRHDGYVQSRPVRCNATALPSNVRASTIARHSSMSVRLSRANACSGCVGWPDASRHYV